MKIRLRSREFEVESLTFSDVEKFDGDGTFTKCPMAGVGLYASKEARGAAMAVVLASLRRAAPDLTADEIADEITVDNFGPLISAVMGITKILPKEGDTGEG